jgi:uncharacterized protein YqeY
MSLLATIKADQLKARKERNGIVAAILTTLIGEVETKSKKELRELTDTEVIAIIKKFLDGVNECIDKSTDGEKRDHSYVEKVILEGYMPKQLEVSEIQEILLALSIGEPDGLNVGKAMSHFKQYYAGRYDGRLLKALVDAHNDQVKSTAEA